MAKKISTGLADSEQKPKQKIEEEKDTINREWYLIDAKDQYVGRLATKIAKIFFSEELDQKKFTDEYYARRKEIETLKR